MSESMTLPDMVKSLPSNTDNAASFVTLTSQGALALQPLARPLSEGADLDEIAVAGIYKLQQNCAPMPSGVSSQGCILLHFHWDSNRKYQLMFAVNGVYTRMKAMEWKPWQKISTTTVSSSA